MVVNDAHEIRDLQLRVFEENPARGLYARLGLEIDPIVDGKVHMSLVLASDSYQLTCLPQPPARPVVAGFPAACVVTEASQVQATGLDGLIRRKWGGKADFKRHAFRHQELDGNFIFHFVIK